MTASISRQLVFWLAVPLMLLALCGALVHYFNSVAPGVIASDKRLRDATNALMAHVQYSDGRLSLDAHADAALSLPDPAFVVYAIRDARGHVLMGRSELPGVSLNPDTSQLIAMSQFNKRAVRSLTTRFDAPYGVMLITVADIGAVAEPAARYGLMSTLLWDFVQLDVTLVLVWVGIRLGLRPMTRLRDAIAARSPQDLRPIDETSIPREIAPLVVNLNRLFTTLRASAQSQQEFIANTAHQLRTPITGLRAQLDLLIAEPDAAPLQGRLITLEEGIKQLSHSANQLLSLARADTRANVATKKRSVRLDALVGDVAARYFDRALQSNIDLGVETVPVGVMGDSALLDDLLSNLVDNALKYSPDGGRVTISAGEDGGRPFLSVDDTGVGIPAGERQRVRQRFYRMPNSRIHGSGLGLAIVDEIARFHDATVAIGTCVDGRGTHVVVRFS